jgi:antitoxin (DNA-binding transcriptional repressor) of toxin-antitoxin stability system
VFRSGSKSLSEHDRPSAKIIPFRRVIVTPRMNDLSDRIADLERAKLRTLGELQRYRMDFNTCEIHDRERLRQAIENTELALDLIKQRIDEERKK